MQFLQRTIFVLLLSFAATSSWADPKCDGPNNWAASMAFVHLKNAGLTDSYKTLHKQISVTRIASQRVGKDLYRQVHRVTLPQVGGKAIDVLTVSDASSQECSMDEVEVFVVSQRLGG
jgi:hypothetical protein